MFNDIGTVSISMTTLTFIGSVITRRSSDADKPARRVYTFVIPTTRRFLDRLFDLQLYRDLENPG